MEEQERIAHYDRDYFTKRNCPEIESWRRGILRPGDMGAALCYALGYTSYDQARRVMGIPEDNPRFLPITTIKRQVLEIDEHENRFPRRIVEVGCGRGEMMEAFLRLGINWIGIDPSPAVPDFIRGIGAKLASEGRESFPKGNFHNVRLGNSGMALRGFYFDTVIFCESIEHIPEQELRDSIEGWIAPALAHAQGLLIITNWIDNHPLLPDGTGYDHITRIDDDLYNWLAAQARRTVFRQGSHLVLQF